MLNFDFFVLYRNEDDLLLKPRKNIQNVTFKFPQLYFYGIISMTWFPLFQLSVHCYEQHRQQGSIPQSCVTVILSQNSRCFWLVPWNECRSSNQQFLGLTNALVASKVKSELALSFMKKCNCLLGLPNNKPSWLSAMFYLRRRTRKYQLLWRHWTKRTSIVARQVIVKYLNIL